MKIFPQGGVAPPSVNLGPPHISKLLELESQSFTHISIGPSTLFRFGNFPARGRAGGAAPPSVNLGPPHISETTSVRKLKFYTHFDGANYSFG